MFLFFAGGAAESAHHVPVIVQFVNRYLGEPVYRLQLKYTKPLWDKLFAKFGTDAEKVFGVAYSPDNAIPWYTIMFINLTSQTNYLQSYTGRQRCQMQL